MANNSQKRDVFVSYSHKNKKVADAIVFAMEEHKIKCWYAPRDVLPGNSWAASITDAIEQTKIFVLVYTEDSNQSRQVTNEVTLAVKEGKTVIPFRLTDSDMNDELEYYLSSVHWLDAMEPPLSRNIRVLTEKVLSILKIDGEAVEDSGPDIGWADSDNSARKVSDPDIYRERAEKRDGSRSALVFTCILIVLLAAGIGGFILFGGSDKKPDIAAADGASGVDDSGTMEDPSKAGNPAVTENSTEADHSVEDDIVIFEDPALEYAVRRSTGIWERDLSVEEAENISALNLSGDLKNEYGRISSLKGLEAFKWLEEINLSNNRISDISALSSLSHLRVVNLEKNRIEDIEPLKDLTAVVHLDLNTNNISSLSPLLNLTRMRMLDVRNNDITSIDGLDDMTNLKELYISKNQIEDISPISELGVLTYLSAGYNKIEDISPLANLKALEVVTLKGNNIHDISVLTQLSNLYHIEIADNPIDDYSPLDDLPEGATIVRD